MNRNRRSTIARWLLLSLLLALLAGCGGGSFPKSFTDRIRSEAPESTANDKAGDPSETAEPETGEKQPEKKGVALNQLFTDEQTGLSLQAPLYWEAVMKDGAVVVLVSAQNGPEDLYRENVMITADHQFKDLTLAAYLKALTAEVRKRYPDTETLENGEVEVDGIRGHWLVDSFTLPNSGPAKVYRVVLVREAAAYVFHGTSPAPTFDLYRPVFEAMAKSMTWSRPEQKP